MAQLTNEDLLSSIARLESENAVLREKLHAPTDGPANARTGRRSGWGWTFLATVLMVIGGLLAPAAVAGAWASAQLTSTEDFVSTFAPLADDPGVQAFVTSETVDVIEQHVDIPALTSDVIDGIVELGTGPAASTALESLKGPAAHGMRTLVRSTVNTFVESDAFAQVWHEALRLSHTQLVATLQDDPNAALAVSADGSVGVQFGPIVERVKDALVDQGLAFASQIPAIDRTISIAHDSVLPAMQLYYGLAVAAGVWLPWLALLCLTAGVLVARRRALALVWAAATLAIGMVTLIICISIGRLMFVGSVSPSLIPSGVARPVFDAVTSTMLDTGIAMLVFAVVVACVAWYAGPFAVARSLRAFFGAGIAWVREAAERHGISTGRTGAWLYRQRSLLRAAVATLAAAVLLLLRPLTPALILWTLLLATLLIVIQELLQRPVASTSDAADESPAGVLDRTV